MIVTLRCLLLVGCCAAPLGAMQATTSPPAAATALPRSIADSNAAIDDAATLRKELETLATLAPGVVRDARIAYRRIAFDLLFHGAAADFSAQEMVIAGLRMTAARNDLDRVLERTLPTTTGAAAVNEALRRFTAGAAQGLDPLPPTDHPERALAATLRPLEEAVALLERATPEPPGTAWPDAAQLAAESRPAVPAVADTIAQATWMDESTRTALREASARARSDGGTDALRADTECMRALGAGGRIAAHPEGWTAGAVASGFAALAGAYSPSNAQRLADALAAADTCIAFDSQALRADLRAAAADTRTRALRDGIVWHRRCRDSSRARNRRLPWPCNRLPPAPQTSRGSAPFPHGSTRLPPLAVPREARSRARRASGWQDCAIRHDATASDVPWTHSRRNSRSRSLRSSSSAFDARMPPRWQRARDGPRISSANSMRDEPPGPPRGRMAAGRRTCRLPCCAPCA